MAATEQGQELHLTMANEDYLECMVRIEQEEGAEGGVRSVDIATRLEVSKASVNKAVSVLKAQGLVEQAHFVELDLHQLLERLNRLHCLASFEVRVQSVVEREFAQVLPFVESVDISDIEQALPLGVDIAMLEALHKSDFDKNKVHLHYYWLLEELLRMLED